MRLKEYLETQEPTPVEEYHTCVFHRNDWPAIVAWLEREGVTVGENSRKESYTFENGQYNMARVDTKLNLWVLCCGQRSIEETVEKARHVYDDTPGWPHPLFLHPARLGILPGIAATNLEF
jgi:hypothetical protein